MSHMPLWDGAVVAGDAGPVEHEGDAAAVQRDVHEHLVEGTVEEGGVDRDDRVQPAHRQPGRGGGGVLLGDADVEDAVREAVGEAVEPDRVQHRGGDRRRRRGAPRRCATISSAKTSVQMRPRAASCAGLDVERPRRVELVGLVPLGGVVAVALLGERVHDAPAR